MATYSQGPGTHEIPVSMHATNRQRLAEELRKAESYTEGSIVALAGGQAIGFYSGDTEYDFKQEPFFRYLFGAKEEGFFGIIEVTSGKATLFIPRLPKEYATWMGEIKSPEYFKEAYGVEDVKYTDEVGAFVKSLSPSK